ncbi:MAG: DUF4982 domain-containing protein [Parasporobacterium sp.]|nr:DUF4982 domain-containing protein [Parasporobacterium sp.]
MKFTLFNDNWAFWPVTDFFGLNWAPPADARYVDLPHDAMIEIPQSPDAPAGSNTGFRTGGVYAYNKTFRAEGPDRTYILKIEGAYMNAIVYVNGQEVSKNPFGYTVFYTELNRFLNFNADNEIRVQVRAGAEPNSRWYPGNGLYRDVYLLESGQTYIVPDSVKITTESADSRVGIVRIDADIKASAGIMDSLCLTACIKNSDGITVASGKSVVGEDDDLELTVEHPELWSAEHPYLYSCSLELSDADGVVLDTHTDTFGIRTLSLSPQEGFLVNGEEVKLRGSCIHHDSGILGAKTYEEIHIRQMKKLKEAGFNAVRCAHNPAAPALLRACDKVGMYVMDESFDIWTRSKCAYDYGLYFDEWWEKDIEAMVKNSYNHPSVICYSVGNEIPEAGLKSGIEITKMLSDKVRFLDPTRFTSNAINGMFSVGDNLGRIVMETASELTSKGQFEGNVNNFMAFMNQYMTQLTQHHIVDEVVSGPFEHTDIAGYNYMEGRYDLDTELHPDRIIVGSETGISTIHYNWPRVMKYKNVIGDFMWTGWDYLGESGIGLARYGEPGGAFACGYPVQTGCTGEFDITGFRMPMSYYHEIILGLRKDPYIGVKDPAHYGENLIINPWIISDAVASWNWRGYEGKPVSIEVYSDADEVELFNNGISAGRQPAGIDHHYMATFDTTYEPGVLTAVSYTGGIETGRFELLSAEGNIGLKLYEDMPEMCADSDIKVLIAELADSRGITVQDKDTDIKVTLSNGITFLGFGNGNPMPEYNYTEPVARTFRGRAQLIVKAAKGSSVHFESAYGTADYQFS